MHSLQIQDATCIEALQAVRIADLCIVSRLLTFRSFELGGEKKTKGAALTFVCVSFFCSSDDSKATLLSSKRVVYHLHVVLSLHITNMICITRYMCASPIFGSA